jgi:branched-chain amino acid transport system substrate-binding protein
VVQKFRSGNPPYDPESYTLYSYAALQAMAEAAKAENSVDPRRVSNRIRNGQPINTVLGPIAWDNKGDRRDADYVMYVWRNGTYQQM